MFNRTTSSKACENVKALSRDKKRGGRAFNEKSAVVFVEATIRKSLSVILSEHTMQLL